MDLPDMLGARIDECLADATPAALARTDQIAGMWRDFFTQRGLDLTEPTVNAAAMRTLTMVYGLIMAAQSQDEISATCFTRLNDIMAASATAIVVSGHGDMLPQLNQPFPGVD